MSDTNSILDRVMESQERQLQSLFNPHELVVELLKNLSNKEEWNLKEHTLAYFPAKHF